MAFLVEFNELKSSLESTVAKNPVLLKEQEFFVFSNINATKNRIFRSCLGDETAFAKFTEIIERLISTGNSHEVFMTDSFACAEDYDYNSKMTASFVASIKDMAPVEIMDYSDNFNISYDIYSEVLTAYESNGKPNMIFEVMQKDMQYHIDKIYLSNVKIILRILSAYKNTVDLTVKDLFSEGTLGLRRAIELFNCNLGIKFSTYASQWIKASINRAIADKDSLIRIPVNVREQSKEVERIRKELRTRLNRDPLEEEIIVHMKKKVSSLSNLDVSFAYYQIDTDAKFNDNSNPKSIGASFEDNLIDGYILDESDNVTIKDLRSLIREYVNTVDNDAEQYYLKYHFGINQNSEIKSKEEIITELNIQPNEYDRIRKKAISNLKRVLGKNKTLIEAYAIETGWESHSNLEF